MRLSLLDECRTRVEQALSSLALSANRDARREMQLNGALGASLVYTRGPTTEAGLAWASALEHAERLGDTEYQLRALRGLWAYRMENGEYRDSLLLAQRFCGLAGDQVRSGDVFVGERMIGNSLHFLGDQTNARRHIERALHGNIISTPRLNIGRFQFDQRVTALAMFARILWLQGFPDQALRNALISVDEAHTIEHALSLCNALAQAACPVALWVGDLPTAERCIAMLLEYTDRHGLISWRLWGRVYRAMLMSRGGDIAAGLELIKTTLEELRRSPHAGAHYGGALLGTSAEALGAAGRVDEGLTAINEAIAWSERTQGRVNSPELLRVKGELLLLQAEEGAAAMAEDHFRQALDWARRQGALSWGLRAATSLARLLRDQGSSADATAVLQPVYGQFTEGFDTADLTSARRLLGELSGTRRD